MLFASPVLADDLTLPDPTKTPGVSRTDLTVAQICTTRWGRDRRHVTSAMKNQVFLNYSIPPDARHDEHRKSLYEIDHLISRELGGADEIANLWPEPYEGACNAHAKDRLENELHKEVCADPSDDKLHEAQTAIATNWIAEYEKRFGSCH